MPNTPIRYQRLRGSAGSVDPQQVNAVQQGVELLSDQVIAATRQAAYQAVPYAASIAIDPTAGATVQVGSLTGALAVAAPVNPQNGDVLRYNFVQDGTGGRVVTWDPAFDADAVAAQPIDTTASKRSSATFVYSGGVWQ